MSQHPDEPNQSKPAATAEKNQSIDAVAAQAFERLASLTELYLEKNSIERLRAASQFEH